MANPSMRQEKQREKTVKRQERNQNKPDRPAGEGGVDPDIAHIIPGPQPIPEEDQEL